MKKIRDSKKASGGINTTLNTAMGLVIAGIVIISILGTSTNLYAETIQKNTAQKNNFNVLLTLLEHSSVDSKQDYIPYIQKEYIIVGFPKLSKISGNSQDARSGYEDAIEIKRECSNKLVVDYVTSFANIVTGTVELETSITKYKCNPDYPCICMCKIGYDNIIDCTANSICVSLTSESTKNIEFAAYDKQGVENSCSLPIVYSSEDVGMDSTADNLQYMYCIHREKDVVTFEPKQCDYS